MRVVTRACRAQRAAPSRLRCGGAQRAPALARILAAGERRAGGAAAAGAAGAAGGARALGAAEARRVAPSKIALLFFGH